MERNCPTVNITEIYDTKATISAVYQEGEHPAIVNAKIMANKGYINGVKGLEGELIMTSINNQNGGELDNGGNLIITTEDDDARNYSIKDLDLIYNG